jgi:O-antigen ligase
LVSTLISDQLFRAFIGDTQRKNGFFTYLIFTLLFLYFVKNTNFNNVRKLLPVIFCTSIAFGAYGLSQSLGYDFIRWNNPYNSIIGTLGNPNFASAFCAIIASYLFVAIFDRNIAIFYKISIVPVVILLLFLIIYSNSRQGILSFLIAIMAFIVILAMKFNAKVAIFSVGLTSIVIIMAVLGMLQQGPLKSVLYKDSISVRGFYWRAAWEMFQSSPIFGVGVDSYGAYFKEFREVDYTNRYGYEITSSNAHNVILQHLSTAGILVTAGYLLIIAYVAKRSWILLKNSTGSNFILSAALFCSWIAFQSQSMISIDNIGVAIWGWMLGGILVGLSMCFDQKVAKQISNKTSSSVHIAKILVGILISIPALSASVFLYRSENQAWLARAYLSPDTNNTSEFFVESANKVLDNPLSDPTLEFRVSVQLVQSGLTTEGLDSLRSLLAADNRNLDVLNVLAIFEYQIGNPTESISLREKIIDLDPWNAKNYLELGKLYLILGSKQEAVKVLDKLNIFAPKSVEALELDGLLV